MLLYFIDPSRRTILPLGYDSFQNIRDLLRARIMSHVGQASCRRLGGDVLLVAKTRAAPSGSFRIGGEAPYRGHGVIVGCSGAMAGLLDFAQMMDPSTAIETIRRITEFT